MPKKIISHLLCFVMAWTTVMPAYAGNDNPLKRMDEAGIRAKYPDAKIIRVSESDYPALAERLKHQGYRTSSMHSAQQLATTERVQQLEQQPPAINQNTAPSRDQQDCSDGSFSPGDSSSDSSLQGVLDFSSDMMESSGDGEDAAVVFVIIGVVLLVVWTLYVFKYLYDVSMGAYPCRWSELSVTSSTMSGEAEQHAYFHGLNYKTGIRDGITEFGISAEIGDSDILLVETGELRLKGLYWLIGPMLRWRLTSDKNPHYFQMDFVAGSTEHDEMDIIAKASMGLRLGISDAMYVSLNWGALNINLNENQGIINDHDQYYYLYGFNVGYRF